MCVLLQPGHAPSWRELGTTRGALQEAAEAFARAVQLDDSDAETWATLGGLHRRLARRDDPERFDATELEKALDCYRAAIELGGNDTYPLLNEARVELLLSGVRRTDPAPVFDRFHLLEHLARFTAADAAGTDPWPAFDLAERDAHLGGDVGVGTCLARLHEPPTALDAQGRIRVGHSSSSRSQTTAGATPIVRACRIAAFQPRGATRIRFPSGSAARKVSPNPAS